ncbi:MAG: HAD-IIA family hydrolase, partial [Candidatus Methanomethylicaceae archaeon]
MSNKIEGLIIDLDGCVYKGEELIEGADVAINALKESGKKVLFLTNNSTKSPDEYVDKLRRFGIDICKEDILTSAIATAQYMQRFERGGCYVVGERALKEALTQGGFTLIGDDKPEDARYVVCGLDRNLTYGKLSAACIALQNGVKFIATNADPSLPVEKGYLPGAGSIVGAIRIATGIKPIVVGKPSRYIMDIAIKRLGLDRRKIAIVGDRIDID